MLLHLDFSVIVYCDFCAVQESESFPGQPSALPIDAKDEDAISGPAWLAGESQPVENSDFDSLDDLLCNEIFDSCAQLNDLGMNTTTVNGFAGNTNLLDGNENASFGIPDLDNIQLDTPPDFQLSVSPQSPSLTLLL